MFYVDGYDSIRFDTLGDLPVDGNGFIRMDRSCTPGKTIPCGNACRTPVNCKAKGGARVSEKGKDLRQSYANKVRASKGLADRESANTSKRTRQKESVNDKIFRSGVAVMTRGLENENSQLIRAAGNVEKSRRARQSKAEPLSDRDRLNAERAKRRHFRKKAKVNPFA